MTIWWCAGCGMEDTRSHNACPSCSSALQVGEVSWLHDVDHDVETVFELDPEPIERAAIVEGLMSQKISHRWEGLSDLVVLDADADAVDTILDEVLGADSREDDDDTDEADDDDGVEDFDDEYDDEHGAGGDDYNVLSDLYVATDRLQKHRDEEDIAEYLGATGAALATGQPFGVDEDTWADIQSAARNVAAALESDSDASIEGDLKALRNQLQQLV
jgi:hypothetical protein